MFEALLDLPQPTAPSSHVIEKCIQFNSDHFGVPKLAIQAILDVEGGKVCTVSKNKNGSYDLGLMQINTINLNQIKESYSDITPADIACKPCLNITIGTWLLSQRINETNDVWKGIGHYHSRTPKYRDRYLKKISNAVSKIMKQQAHSNEGER